MLFCPECDHASLPDGDWLTFEDERVRALECPDCGTFIEVRPRFDDAEGADRPVSPVARAGLLWLDAVTDWMRAWSFPGNRGGA